MPTITTLFWIALLAIVVLHELLARRRFNALRLAHHALESDYRIAIANHDSRLVKLRLELFDENDDSVTAMLAHVPETLEEHRRLIDAQAEQAVAVASGQRERFDGLEEDAKDLRDFVGTLGYDVAGSLAAVHSTTRNLVAMREVAIGLHEGVVPDRSAVLQGLELGAHHKGDHAAVLYWSTGQRSTAVFSGQDYTRGTLEGSIALGLSYAEFLAIGLLFEDGVDTLQDGDAYPETTGKTRRKPAQGHKLAKSVRFVEAGKHVLRDVYEDRDGGTYAVDTKVESWTSTHPRQATDGAAMRPRDLIGA